MEDISPLPNCAFDLLYLTEAGEAEVIRVLDQQNSARGANVCRSGGEDEPEEAKSATIPEETAEGKEQEVDANGEVLFETLTVSQTGSGSRSCFARGHAERWETGSPRAGPSSRTAVPSDSCPPLPPPLHTMVPTLTRAT